MSSKKILVVDDEEELCEVTADILENMGYEVDRAFDANTALQKVKGGSYDAVLTDICMPGKSGKELLIEIKNIDVEKPKVLLMTGFAQMTLEEAYDLGAEAVLAKPVPTENLLNAIERLLARSKVDAEKIRERFDIETKVEIQLPNDKEFVRMKTVNLGRGGIFIELSENFPKAGDLINFRLSFYQPEFGSFEGKAICRWVRDKSDTQEKTGIGIEFMDLNAQASKKLLTLINDLKVRAYIPKG